MGPVDAERRSFELDVVDVNRFAAVNGHQGVEMLRDGAAAFDRILREKDRHIKAILLND